MFKKILVVCVGNICRSPTAEFLLKKSVPSLEVSSAGLGALVGHDMDETARMVAEAAGLSCPKHVARQLNANLCHEADLILVMESGHKEAISRMCPEARGKIFLLGQGGSDSEIPDPYRKGKSVFSSVYEKIDAACTNWARRLER